MTKLHLTSLPKVHARFWNQPSKWQLILTLVCAASVLTIYVASYVTKDVPRNLFDTFQIRSTFFTTSQRLVQPAEPVTELTPEMVTVQSYEKSWQRKDTVLSDTESDRPMIHRSRLRNLLQSIEEKMTHTGQKKVVIRGQNSVISRDLPVYEDAFKKLGFVLLNPTEK